ncbi:MAG: glycine cleavage system protein GcvH [Fuerstiella sp.]
MNVPENLKYAESHEWVRVDEGDVATVGISDYAQVEMTEVVYVELPEIGRQCKAGEEVAVVESVKSASDIYAPVGGEIVEVNEALSDNPGLVNEAPYGDGWIFRIRMSDASQLDGLLDAAGYGNKIS